MEMNSSSITYRVDSFETITVRLFQYAGTSLHILANFGNIFSALIFTQKSWQKNVCVFYFLVCLFLDFLNINFSLLGYILVLGFNIKLIDSNVVLCKLFSYLTVFPSTLSGTVLVLASIDRLFISSQNVDSRLYSSKRLAYFSITIGTVFWFLFFFHILIKFNIQYFDPSISICIYDPSGFYLYFFLYSMLIINVILFSSMIVLSILSFKNVRQILPIARRQRQNVRTMRKKDFQFLRCLFARNMMYIICNILYCAQAIFRLIVNPTQTSSMEEYARFIYNVGTLIHHIPFGVNFYIYVMLSKAFRKELKRLIWKVFGRDLPPIREEEQNEPEINNDDQELNVMGTITA